MDALAGERAWVDAGVGVVMAGATAPLARLSDPAKRSALLGDKPELGAGVLTLPEARAVPWSSVVLLPGVVTAADEPVSRLASATLPLDLRRGLTDGGRTGVSIDSIEGEACVVAFDTAVTGGGGAEALRTVSGGGTCVVGSLSTVRGFGGSPVEDGV